MCNERHFMAQQQSDDERRMQRALARSLAVAVACAATIGGGWLLLSMPRVRVADATKPIGPQDVATPRTQREQTMPTLVFTDVARAAGVDFVHTTGAKGDKLLPETMVGGVAVFDADSDGRLDLLLVRGCEWTGAAFESPPTPGQSSVVLYLNQTDPRTPREWSFRRADGCGLDCDLYAMGVAIGDYDGDGREDVFVTGVGRNMLFRNETPTAASSQPLFRNTTVAANADPPSEHPRWGTSAGFFDADGDGDLDLLVANYVRWSPSIDRAVDYRLAGIGRAYGPPTGFEGEDPLFLRNRGDGTFENATIDAGLASRSTLGRPADKALGLCFIDPQVDGQLDVVIANDTVANRLFVRGGAGRFVDQSTASGIAYDRNGAATGAMGIDSAWLRAAAQPTGDDLAVAIGNFANEPDSLYIARGRSLQFSDDAIVEGLAAATRLVLTFGLVMVDLDLDGRPDIAQANGHIEDEIARIQSSQSYAQRGQVFLNQGGPPPCLVEVPPDRLGALADPRVGRGLAFGDLDGDGDVDLVLAQAGGSVALLRNDQAAANHWIALRMRCSTAKWIGATVEVEHDGRMQRQLLSPTRSYLSQSAGGIVIGLGGSTSVQRMRIRWSDGSVQPITADGVDRVIDVVPLERR
jgi:hypothetical protein